jgi:hypothetical protein
VLPITCHNNYKFVAPWFYCDELNMIRRIGRAIFAVLIGLSIGVLPATIGLAAGVAAATEISASTAMPDCDHHHNAPDTQTHKSVAGGACMADCAFSCFCFTATGYSGIAFSSLVSDVLNPVRVSDAVSSRMGSPPFRPPRA